MRKVSCDPTNRIGGCSGRMGARPFVFPDRVGHGAPPCDRKQLQLLSIMWPMVALQRFAENVSSRRVSSFQAAPVAIINHNEASSLPDNTPRYIFSCAFGSVDVRETTGLSRWRLAPSRKRRRITLG